MKIRSRRAVIAMLLCLSVILTAIIVYLGYVYAHQPVYHGTFVRIEGGDFRGRLY